MALPASPRLAEYSYTKFLPHLKWKTGVPKGPGASRELRELLVFGGIHTTVTYGHLS